jgi:O-acetyl-ADP-ribose deacetylase (regulator of RNase III)
MLHFVSGDMFRSTFDVIVNPVNCVGVMGKGLALEFKQRFPENFQHYRNVCNRRELHPGGILVYNERGQIIINAATKDDWRNPSEYVYVNNTCARIAEWCIAHPAAHTVAVPKLGCGLGGLNWIDVCHTMKSVFAYCPQNIYIFGENL